MSRVSVGLGLPHRPPVDRALEFVRMAVDHGVDTLWSIDHLASFVPHAAWHEGFSPLASAGGNPSAIFEFQATMGYFAGLEPRINLGVGVTESIRRHPVILAQAAVTLAHLSPGTIRLGIGAGERENVEPYGLSFSGQVSRLEEALTVISRCLAGPGNVTFEGDFFNLTEAPFGLTAPDGKMPEVWVAAHGPRTLELTGRLAKGWLPTVLVGPSRYRELLEKVRSNAVNSGRSGEEVVAGLQVFVVAAEKSHDVSEYLKAPPVKLMGLLQPAEMWSRLGHEHPLGIEFRGHADWRPHEMDRRKLDKLLSLVPDDVAATSVLHGIPEEIGQQILAYHDAGVQHIVLQQVPGIPLAKPSSPASLLSLAERIVSSS